VNKQPVDAGVEEIARRVAAAYLSYQMGVGLQYCYKRYCESSQPGEFWMEMARKILKGAPSSLA
jgi:hypothetical protein